MNHHPYAIGEQVRHRVTTRPGMVVGFDFTADVYLIHFPTGVIPTPVTRLEGIGEVFVPQKIR